MGFVFMVLVHDYYTVTLRAALPKTSVGRVRKRDILAHWSRVLLDGGPPLIERRTHEWMATAYTECREISLRDCAAIEIVGGGSTISGAS